MNVMGIIFANDSGLGALTNKRTTASIPFGGRYRQIDFALSNMSVAGIRNIGIISRHNYQSLMNHIGDAEEWGLELGEGGLEFLTPYSMSNTDSYRGKVESLYSAIDFLRYGKENSYVVMSDSAVLANMNLKKVIAAHVESGKDITVVAKPGVANSEKVLDLAVKLDANGEVADMVVDYAAPADYLASIDLFVLSRNWLIDRVQTLIAHNLYHMDRDFVLDGWQKGEVSVNVYTFEGTALFNDSVPEYFANSMALLQAPVMRELFLDNHPIFTKVRDRVPSYYGVGSQIKNCLVADGCSFEGTAENSILFRQVSIGEGAEVRDCVIMNNSSIGAGAHLRYCILDKDVIVAPGATLVGTPTNPVILKRREQI